MKVLIAPTFEVGSQPPEGYLAWHEWAGVQSKAGLKQRECGVCGKWNFPQEFSKKELTQNLKTGNGRSKIVKSKVCNRCVDLHATHGEKK